MDHNKIDPIQYSNTIQQNILHHYRNKAGSMTPPVVCIRTSAPFERFRIHNGKVSIPIRTLRRVSNQNTRQREDSPMPPERRDGNPSPHVINEHADTVG